MKFRPFWLAWGFAFVALIIYLSLKPDPIDTGRVADVKTGHFIAYAWLMWWFAQIFTRKRQRFGIAVAAIALGIGLEYLQGMTGYRTFAYWDMRDNAIGVLAGWILATTRLGGTLQFVEGSYLRVRGMERASGENVGSE